MTMTTPAFTTTRSHQAAREIEAAGGINEAPVLDLRATHAQMFGRADRRGGTLLSRLDTQLLSLLQHQPFARKMGGLAHRAECLVPLLPALVVTLRAHHPEHDFDRSWPGKIARLPCFSAWAELTFPGEDVITCRADLMTLASWKGTDTDTGGNPVIWENRYRDDMDREWSSAWSCQCDDDGVPPYASDWIGPDCPEEKALWEVLDEA